MVLIFCLFFRHRSALDCYPHKIILALFDTEMLLCISNLGISACQLCDLFITWDPLFSLLYHVFCSWLVCFSRLTYQISLSWLLSKFFKFWCLLSDFMASSSRVVSKCCKLSWFCLWPWKFSLFFLTNFYTLKCFSSISTHKFSSITCIEFWLYFFLYALLCTGEKVLCFHGPLIYEAKCLKQQSVKEKGIKYFIHYAGWNKRLV